MRAIDAALRQPRLREVAINRDVKHKIDNGRG
jgi:hypothetical protein